VKRPRVTEKTKLPRVIPCNDPLALWAVEFRHKGQIVARYFASKVEAARWMRNVLLAKR
jgi:hypothetical protein